MFGDVLATLLCLQDVFRSIAENVQRHFSNPKGNALARLAAMMLKALVLRVRNEGFKFINQPPKHITTQVSELPLSGESYHKQGSTVSTLRVVAG